MTRDQFEKQYAESSGMTVEKLRELGRVVVKCRCGPGICDGWASMPQDLAEEYERRWK